MPRLGFIGTGGMGRPMAANLLKAGFALTVHDARAEKIVSGQFKPRKSWMPKDIGFGLNLANEEGIPLPFTALAKQLFLMAQSCGVDGYEASGIAWKVYALLHGQSPERPS